MRKSFDGLSGIVRNELNLNPICGDIFIFINRRRDQIKLLHWEGDGFSLYYKRLEQGTFEIPAACKNDLQVEIGRDILQLILQGISLQSVERRKRFRNTLPGSTDSSKVTTLRI